MLASIMSMDSREFAYLDWLAAQRHHSMLSNLAQAAVDTRDKAWAKLEQVAADLPKEIGDRMSEEQFGKMKAHDGQQVGASRAASLIRRPDKE
jgi:hypothetical protein